MVRMHHANFGDIYLLIASILSYLMQLVSTLDMKGMLFRFRVCLIRTYMQFVSSDCNRN